MFLKGGSGWDDHVPLCLDIFTPAAIHCSRTVFVCSCLSGFVQLCLTDVPEHILISGFQVIKGQGELCFDYSDAFVIDQTQYVSVNFS